MTACGTDYLTKDILSRSYILVYSTFVYFMPLFLIIYSYFFIIQAVAAHEKNMREQAKKMNVASLRSTENQNTSAECKLAKAGSPFACSLHLRCIIASLLSTVDYLAVDRR